VSDDENTTWRKELAAKFKQYPGEGLVAVTLTDAELDEEFDSGYGSPKGAPFTAWSQNRVYFPVGYDGAEWIGSVPRNPCDEATEHQGGG
jgi:hypothetical protein